MTPVQLPEVPVRECGPHTGHVAVWTEAQLREYATEAVMVERARMWTLIELPLKRLSITYTAKLVGAEPDSDDWNKYKRRVEEVNQIVALITPSETNSG